MLSFTLYKNYKHKNKDPFTYTPIFKSKMIVSPRRPARPSPRGGSPASPRRPRHLLPAGRRRQAVRLAAGPGRRRVPTHRWT